MTSAIERVEAALTKAGAPCLWHGESDGTPQPEHGFRSCAQCERRQDKLVFDQPTLTELVRLAKLGERVEQVERRPGQTRYAHRWSDGYNAGHNDLLAWLKGES